jgi:hypothetical protein
MKNIIIGLCCAVIVLLVLSTVQQSSANNAIIEAIENGRPFNENHKVYSIELPAKLDFAGEAVPLENPDIKERADREFLVNTYWHSNSILLIKRASQYFPIIESILKDQGIPDDFKYLAVIESGLQNVTSPAGAKGFWQIMPATGKELGLEINSNIDERYHVAKATLAACNYLKQSYAKFGSWTLAAAAYNGGNGGINSRLDKQDVTSYYDMHLGDETGRYVFRILAIKAIMQQPTLYGFEIKESHLYKEVPVNLITVNGSIADLAVFAKENGINLKILKIHNAWLRESGLDNAAKARYQIAIPEIGVHK